jgi:hypothetical protein
MMAASCRHGDQWASGRRPRCARADARAHLASSQSDGARGLALAVRHPAVGLDVVPPVPGQRAPGTQADAGVRTLVAGQTVDDDIVLRTSDPGVERVARGVADGLAGVAALVAVVVEVRIRAFEVVVATVGVFVEVQAELALSTWVGFRRRRRRRNGTESRAVPPSSAAATAAMTMRREPLMTRIMFGLLSLVFPVTTNDG